MHHQGRGAHGDQVVHRHGDGVLGDAVVVALAGQRGHLVGHQGLGAQAFDDGGEVHRAHIDHIGRLAARGQHFAEAVAGQVRAGFGRSTLGGDLQRVDQVIVDTGLVVGEGRVGVVMRVGRRGHGASGKELWVAKARLSGKAAPLARQRVLID